MLTCITCLYEPLNTEHSWFIFHNHDVDFTSVACVFDRLHCVPSLVWGNLLCWRGITRLDELEKTTIRNKEMNHLGSLVRDYSSSQNIILKDQKLGPAMAMFLSKPANLTLTETYKAHFRIKHIFHPIRSRQQNYPFLGNWRKVLIIKWKLLQPRNPVFFNNKLCQGQWCLGTQLC